MARPIILIDGFSLVFRAYHALSRTGMQTPTGEPTFAVFAFANILIGLLDKQKPEAMAVVFDTSAPTFRHEVFDQYKANRDAFPDDLVPQMSRIKALIDLMGLPRIELPGYEADDLIGTISKRESNDGHEVLCVTSDKDYFQLVNDKVLVLRPGKDPGTYDKYDASKVEEKFGVPPHQVIDVLALMGDAVDNVPGVKGIGEKTAIPLIQQFGTLEAMYERLSEVEKTGVRKKLEESRDMAFLSKHLVTIHTDAPIDAKRDALTRKEMDFVALDSLCEELGFTNLRHRFRQLAANQGVTLPASDFLERSPALGNRSLTDEHDEVGEHSEDKTYLTAAQVEHEYILVDTPGGLEDVINEIGTPQWLSIDLETTGLDAMSCAIVGIALSVKEGRAFYIDVFDRSDDPDASLFTEQEATHGIPVSEVIQNLTKAHAQAQEIKQLDAGRGRQAIAGLYLAEKKYPEAFAEFDAVLKEKPDDYAALYQVGRLAAVSGQQLDRGLATLRQCLSATPPENQPGHAAVHWRLGNILEKQNDKAAARAAYEAALKVDPKFPQAIEALKKL